jgi:hypothetical protein
MTGFRQFSPLHPGNGSVTKMMRSIVSAVSLLLALGACSVPSVDANQAARNANTPGWTGRTVVIGSTSTIAGNALATYDQQKWQLGRDR